MRNSHFELNRQAPIHRRKHVAYTSQKRGRGTPFHGADGRTARRLPLGLFGVVAL